jgi:DNA-binding beta-propeller fold protein YncE
LARRHRPSPFRPSSVARARCAGGAGVLALLLATPFALPAQQGGAPVNDRPNPFTTIEGWAKMPEGRTWGSTSAVDIDPDGTSIWVGERCGANTCVGSTLDPILKFDATGKLVKSFGAGIIMWPHGIHVDRQGNVWVTDGQDNLPRRPRGAPADAPLPPAPAKVVGHQVHKFSPDGKLLLSLGAPGGGRDANYFWQPNDVLVAPDGSIFVAEGHGGDNARVLKFAADGKFLMAWGKKGTGRGEFDQPHALALDSQGRLFVADRSNNRLQIFDQSGKWLDEWTQFSRISGLWIDKNDVLYAADSESGSIEPSRKAWLRGIRIGSAKDGTVQYFIPDPDVNSRNTSAAEGVAVDKNGVIYGAEVGPKALKRYVKK